jgi:hypothetical protein
LSLLTVVCQAPLVALLQKLADLERVVSRVHAGTVKLADFISLLDSFAKIMVRLAIPRGGGCSCERQTAVETVQPELSSLSSRRLRGILAVRPSLFFLRSFVSHREFSLRVD